MHKTLIINNQKELEIVVCNNNKGLCNLKLRHSNKIHKDGRLKYSREIIAKKERGKFIYKGCKRYIQICGYE